MIVAAASSKLKVGRCFQLLKAAGITARIAYRGDDHMVEVPANQRHASFEVIERNRKQVRAPPNTPRTQRIPLWARLASITIVSMWVTGVLAWLVLVAVNILSSPGVPEPTIDPIAADEFYRIWLSLFIAGFLLLALGLLRRNRPIAAVKHRESR